MHNQYRFCHWNAGASAGAEPVTSQSVAALRKELQEVQSQVAEEAGHVAQFKSLAESAEENTSIVQVSVQWSQALSYGVQLSVPHHIRQVEKLLPLCWISSTQQPSMRNHFRLMLMTSL